MNEDQAKDQGKKISKVIAKCWSDEAFKKKLLADPAATLKTEGIDPPAGMQVRALENTDKVFHLVIPAKPTDLSDEDLDKVAAGAKGYSAANRCNARCTPAERSAQWTCL